MESSSSAEPVVEISSAILLSSFIHSFLLGIILTQYAKYWVDYRDDSLSKRLFIMSVVLVSILQTMLEDYKSWRTVISNKQWSTSKLQWSNLFLNGIVSSLCEGFFVRRCWKVSNRNFWVLFPLSALLITLLIATIYLAITTGVASRPPTTGDTVLHADGAVLVSLLVAFSYWIYGSLVLDLVVTIIMVKFLWHSRTGSARHDRIVRQIVIITLKSAALPSICMLIAAAVVHVSSHLKNHPVLFFVLMTGKLHAIGLFTALNSRAKLRERMKSQEIVQMSFARWQCDPATSRIPGSVFDTTIPLDTPALRSALVLVAQSPVSTGSDNRTDMPNGECCGQRSSSGVGRCKQSN